MFLGVPVVIMEAVDAALVLPDSGCALTNLTYPRFKEAALSARDSG